MLTKENILEEIRRTAKENGDVPLGLGRFGKETGIKLWDCQKYWSTFGEAQREAGFTSNTLQVAHSEEFLFGSLIELMREVGRFPTRADLVVKRNKDAKFPSPQSFHYRWNTKRKLAEKIFEYAKQEGDGNIMKLCRLVIENTNSEEDISNIDNIQEVGEVYLFKSGRYYKIGKTNDTVRRGNELRIQLPEKMALIHSIKTDDPSGIEAYWHRRFEPKRKNGEWFDLNTSDVKTFKRWRRIT